MIFSNPVRYKRFKISTLSLDPKPDSYAFHPNVALSLGSSSTAHIFNVSRRPVSAPMSSNRGMLMAFNGASLDFVASNLVLTLFHLHTHGDRRTLRHKPSQVRH